MKNIFTAKYWKIKRANWRITKFRFFYSWQNILKMIISLGFILPVLFVFVIIPQWFFDKLKEFITDNMPGFLKIDENPAYTKMNNVELRNWFNSLKDWE